MVHPFLADALIERAVGCLPPGRFEAARDAFEARCGGFTLDDPFYEERLRAMTEELVLGLPDVVRSVCARADERAWCDALLHAERGLFRTRRLRAELVIECLLRGATYLVHDAPDRPAHRLVGNEVFDGRIASVDGRVEVLSGMIFHAEEAHPCVAQLALTQRGAPTHPTRAFLDALLRMRMRHDRFMSIHARHLYVPAALDSYEIQSAAWKR